SLGGLRPQVLLRGPAKPGGRIQDPINSLKPMIAGLSGSNPFKRIPEPGPGGPVRERRQTVRVVLCRAPDRADQTHGGLRRMSRLRCLLLLCLILAGACCLRATGAGYSPGVAAPEDAVVLIRTANSLLSSRG